MNDGNIGLNTDFRGKFVLEHNEALKIVDFIKIDPFFSSPDITILKNFFEVQLTRNVTLVSVLQQSDSTSLYTTLCSPPA